MHQPTSQRNMLACLLAQDGPKQPKQDQNFGNHFEVSSMHASHLCQHVCKLCPQVKTESSASAELHYASSGTKAFTEAVSTKAHSRNSEASSIGGGRASMTDGLATSTSISTMSSEL